MRPEIADFGHSILPNLYGKSWKALLGFRTIKIGGGQRSYNFLRIICPTRCLFGYTSEVEIFCSRSINRAVNFGMSCDDHEVRIGSSGKNVGTRQSINGAAIAWAFRAAKQSAVVGVLDVGQIKRSAHFEGLRGASRKDGHADGKKDAVECPHECKIALDQLVSKWLKWARSRLSAIIL